MHIPRKFVKVKEDFKCDNCASLVSGNGYTNHCPKCLYSKHVDKESPGDRLSECNELMKPIFTEYKNREFIITHECIKCKKRKRNISSDKDDRELLINLGQN